MSAPYLLNLDSHDDEPEHEHDDWQLVDLTDPELDQPPTPPDLGHFLYSGMRHLISGPPEATKTLILYHALIELAAAGRNVGIVDFEMGSRRAKLLLRELGATDEHLARFRFVEPETAPKTPLEQLFAGCAIVVIDASVGAFRASGLDDNSRVDAERFAEAWIKPLWRAGIATAVIDHVTKDRETRGSFAIGSERKVGQADVHIGLTTDHKLERGGRTTITVETHKDRPAFLRRPTCFFIDITSDEHTHQLTVTYREPERMQRTEKGGQRPTINMDRVSKWLQQQDGPQSRNAIETAVTGNRDSIRRAVDVLIAEGFCSVSEGPRKSILITLDRPYSRLAEETAERAAEATQTTTSPTSPPLRPDFAQGEVGNRTDSTSPTSPKTPPYGGLGVGEVEDVPEGEEGDQVAPTSPNDGQSEIERLAAKYHDLLGD